MSSIAEAGNTPGQVTLLRAADPFAGSDDTVTDDGTVLDGRIAPGLATISVRGGVEVIPELSGLVLLGVGLGGLALFAGRRMGRKSRFPA